MPIHREFLGGNRPALAAAAEQLLERYARGPQARLGSVAVVLPTSRAGRRLLELLVDACERQKLALEPPRIVTLGKMPELLYEIKKPLASDLTQRFAWAKTLLATPPSLLDQVIPHPPAADDWEGWLELGDLVKEQHRELAADYLNFETVLEEAKSLPGFDEEPRWRALDDVQKRYLLLLDSLGVWDLQTARLFAIREKICRLEHDLILVGVADMNAAMRMMLDQVAPRVTALVHAPAAWSERFDRYGCIDPDKWRDEHLAIDDQHVHRVDGPADQAYAVAEQIASFGGSYRADEVSIGLGDESIAPQIARQLSEFGVTTRFVKTRTVETMGPYRLLAAVAEYLHRPSFAAFAALVRHPDLYDWVLRQQVAPTMLPQLDDLQMHRLPTDFENADAAMKNDWPAAVKALEVVSAWLKPLRTPKLNSLSAWIEPVEGRLVEIYRHREFRQLEPHDHATLETLEALRKALAALAEVPPKLAPQTTAADALDLVLDAARDKPVPPLADDSAVEMLGWFELPLDDAPVVIVTSFNEGCIPTSHSSDIFLPNRLRSHLRLEKNTDRQYARDAYAASILLATRRDVRWIVARHDAQRSPLLPSRLLFAADRETIAERAYQYFADVPRAARPRLLLGGAFDPQPQSQLFVPQPQQLALPIDHLNVTDFRTYLACPYRFYLKRMLRLSSLGDAAEELDALQFGNLLHAVLQSFGYSHEARDLTDERKLADWLSNELYTLAREHYGDTRRAAVNVQVEQLRYRLNAFADWQAQRRRDGWAIEHVELKLNHPLTFGPHTIDVQGRIDRVDHHLERDEWMVLDYKSGERGDHPQYTHRKGDDWIDLQLPLYRRLAQTLPDVTAPPQVGYIVLPKRREDVGARLPEWTDADWKSADVVAAQVVSDILAQRFWPPNYDQRYIDEEFAPICQDFVAGRRLELVEGAAS